MPLYKLALLGCGDVAVRDYLPELHLRNARGFAAFEALTLV